MNSIDARSCDITLNIDDYIYDTLSFDISGNTSIQPNMKSLHNSKFLTYFFNNNEWKVYDSTWHNVPIRMVRYVLYSIYNGKIPGYIHINDKKEICY